MCCCRRAGDEVTSKHWWDGGAVAGAPVPVCTPPDRAERLVRFGVPLMALGPPVRSLVYAARPPSVAEAPRLAAE
jgi:hypothetical protein